MSSKLALYLNRVQVGTRTVPRTEGFGAVPVLGWANAPWLQRFQGEVDEAALYGTALSLAQVQAHYAARTGTAGSYTQAVRADGPLAAWRLGEAADARTGLVEARDSTGNGHTLLSGLGGLRDVLAGGWTSLGQRSDGTSWSWGEGDGDGRLGEPLPWNRAEPRPIPSLSGMQTLSGGTEHSLALLPGRAASTTYAYDRLQRLTGVTAPAPQGSTTYGYDRVGNRVTRTRRGLSTTYAYDRADRITATQELGALNTAYTLDANGNTVQRGAETFGYDQANRLRSSSLGAVSYAYNGDGVRVSTTVGALTTRFVSDVNGSLPVVLTETGPTGTRKYVYGAGGLAYVDEGLVTGIRVYHTDGLGSVRALTDSRGRVMQTYQTDEFGIPESLSSLGASTQSFQYTGEQRDQETGFVYLRARMYDPQLGRFIQADPLRKSGPGVGGWNRYAYVGNNPVGRTDPSGLCVDPGGPGIRYCIEAFIPQESVLGFTGDNRGPVADDQTATYRIHQQFTRDASGTVVESHAIGVSRFGPLARMGDEWGCIGRGTTKPQVLRTAFLAGCTASDGLAFTAAPPASYVFAFTEEADGNVTFTFAEGTRFPSLEVWQYGGGNDPKLIFFYDSAGLGKYIQDIISFGPLPNSVPAP